MRILAALLLAAAASVQAAPSTFGPVIGNALLCRSHLDNAYFHSYLTTAFGPAYKREGGAWWFKADGSLWGATISEILVSDDSAPIVFIGAVTDSPPAELDTAIRASNGVRHHKIDRSAFPVLESGPGSRIVYFNNKSKIYCARIKPEHTGH
jgi:hypothetical protein